MKKNNIKTKEEQELFNEFYRKTERTMSLSDIVQYDDDDDEGIGWVEKKANSLFPYYKAEKLASKLTLQQDWEEGNYSTPDDDFMGHGHGYSARELLGDNFKPISVAPKPLLKIQNTSNIFKDNYIYAYKEKIKALKLLNLHDKIILVCDKLKDFKGEHAIYAYKEKIEALKQLGRLEEVVENCDLLVELTTSLNIESEEVYLSGVDI